MSTLSQLIFTLDHKQEGRKFGDSFSTAEAAGTSVRGLAPQLNQLCDLSCLVELLSQRLALVDPTLWDFGGSEELRLEAGTSPAGPVALPHTCYNVTSQCTRATM